ncbi:MAG: hypothetical protein IKO24_00085 [Bacteroidales bacterium]|nr:hypothetical protein [Bacteroidales bacterium]
MTQQEELRLKNQFIDDNPHACRGLKAATAHIKTYTANADKTAIKTAWVDEINEIAGRYSGERTLEEYVNDVRELQTYMNDRFPDSFYEGEFSFARAQKSLSVVLKYRWCHGDIVMPLACPIDRKVLHHMGCPFDTWNWAEMTEDQFSCAYARLREVAANMQLSIAQLELIWFA